MELKNTKNKGYLLTCNQNSKRTQLGSSVKPGHRVQSTAEINNIKSFWAAEVLKQLPENRLLNKFTLNTWLFFS